MKQSRSACNWWRIAEDFEYESVGTRHGGQQSSQLVGGFVRADSFGVLKCLKGSRDGLLPLVIDRVENGRQQLHKTVGDETDSVGQIGHSWAKGDGVGSGRTRLTTR